LSSRLIRGNLVQTPDVFVLTLPKHDSAVGASPAEKAEARADRDEVLRRAADEAAQIIQGARAEAEAIIAAARAEAEGIREAARQEGYSQGRADAREELLARRAELDQLVAAVNQERERFLSEAEPQLAQLALMIAAKVIEREVVLAGDVAVTIARACIRKIKERRWLRIHVNPENIDSIRAAREEILAQLGTDARLEVAEDARVDRGGCVIESPSGVVDARIQTRIDILQEALEDALNSGTDSEADTVLYSPAAA